MDLLFLAPFKDPGTATVPNFRLAEDDVVAVAFATFAERFRPAATVERTRSGGPASMAVDVFVLEVADDLALPVAFLVSWVLVVLAGRPGFFLV